MRNASWYLAPAELLCLNAVMWLTGKAQTWPPDHVHWAQLPYPSSLCAIPVAICDDCSPSILVLQTTHQFLRCSFLKPGGKGCLKIPPSGLHLLFHSIFPLVTEFAITKLCWVIPTLKPSHDSCSTGLIIHLVSLLHGDKCIRMSVAVHLKTPPPTPTRSCIPACACACACRPMWVCGLCAHFAQWLPLFLSRFWCLLIYIVDSGGGSRISTSCLERCWVRTVIGLFHPRSIYSTIQDSHCPGITTVQA